MNGYEVTYYAIKIGSRGFVSNENQLRLKGFLEVFDICNKKDSNKFMNNLKKIVIISSYCIFYSKFEKSWLDPKFVSV